MSGPQSPALRVSKIVLQISRSINIICAVLTAAALPMSFAFEDALRDYYLARPPMNADLIIPTLRVAMVIGFPAFAAMHLLLSRLLAIVETVRTGDPFVPENAVRIKAIAWCLLVIQLLGPGFGLIAEMLQAGGAEVDNWSFSAAGWIAVVLLFVLARVFEEGARIKTDLEAMV